MFVCQSTFDRVLKRKVYAINIGKCCFNIKLFHVCGVSTPKARIRFVEAWSEAVFASVLPFVCFVRLVRCKINGMPIRKDNPLFTVPSSNSKLKEKP